MSLRIWLLAIFVSAGVLGYVTASEATRGQVEPAQPGEASIVLSDFVIQYPYDDPTTARLEEDRSVAGLAFDQDWTVETYPGPTQCLLELRDSKGDLVGSRITTVGSLVPHVEAGMPNFDIDVSGVPTSAEATCSAAEEIPSDGGYRFDEPRIETNEAGRVYLTADVTWTQGGPGVAACTTHLQLADGSTEIYGSVVVDLPEGRQIIGLPDLPTARATVESLECVRYRGDAS